LLQVKLINDEKEIPALKKEWADLLCKSQNNTVFLTFEWILTWLKHCKDNRELMFFTVRDAGGTLVAIAPLMRSKYRALKLLPVEAIEFIGNRDSDYLDFILMEGREEEALEAIFKHINKQRWDILHLRDIPEGSKTLHFLDNFKGILGKRRCKSSIRTTCPYIKLPSSWESYVKTLGRSTRSNIRYYSRRLYRDFEDVRLEVCSDEEEIPRSMDAFMELNLNQWRNKGKRSVFEDKRFRCFQKDISKIFFNKGWLGLNRLMVNGGPSGFLYTFRYNKKICHYLTAITPEEQLTQYRLGTIMLAHSVKSAIQQNMSEFDFMRGAEAYKYYWTSSDRANIKLQVFNSNLRAKMYYVGLEAAMYLKKMARIVFPKRENRQKDVSRKPKN